MRNIVRKSNHHKKYKVLGVIIKPFYATLRTQWWCDRNSTKKLIQIDLIFVVS